MNQIEKFFSLGFEDQIAVMGSDCVLISKGKRTPFKGVLTQKAGDLQVELSGAVYIADAHCLIPCSFTIKELISSFLECNGNKYIITTAVKDPFINFYSCDLTRID